MFSVVPLRVLTVSLDAIPVFGFPAITCFPRWIEESGPT